MARREAELIQLLELLGRGHHPQQHAAVAAAQQAGAFQIEHDPQPTTLERAAADRQKGPGRQVEQEICAPHHWRHPQGLQQVRDRNRHLVGQVALASGGNLKLAAEPLQQQASVGGLAAAHPQLPFQHLQGQPEFAVLQLPTGLLPQAVNHHPLAGAAGRALQAGISPLRCWQRRWHAQRQGHCCIRPGADGGDAQRQERQQRQQACHRMPVRHLATLASVSAAALARPEHWVALSLGSDARSTACGLGACPPAPRFSALVQTADFAALHATRLSPGYAAVSTSRLAPLRQPRSGGGGG